MDDLFDTRVDTYRSELIGSMNRLRERLPELSDTDRLAGQELLVKASECLYKANIASLGNKKRIYSQTARTKESLLNLSSLAKYHEVTEEQMEFALKAMKNISSEIDRLTR